ncbi:MAG: SDR family oxidoreductase [Candidatus Vogelbacteria bacterium]|nr:SDR family oxidoreductase [Candidatus Vogelbacteria bacterium]
MSSEIKNNKIANTLIIGGLSGLGLEIGKLFALKSNIYATSRTVDASVPYFNQVELSINENVETLKTRLNKLVNDLPTIDTLIYNAGFFEDGHIDQLEDNHIQKMINVGITAPALLLQRLLKKQEQLRGLIIITSTSQWTPREYEPLYCATKAGLAMLAKSVSLDVMVKKTLVVGPTGMTTKFWTNTIKKTEGMLSPELVAKNIFYLWEAEYEYRLSRILRDPVRVEILESRP